MPTQITVKVHDSREQSVNRALARKLIYERLDEYVNGETSKKGMRIFKLMRSKDRKDRRREEKSKQADGQEAIDNHPEKVNESQQENDYLEYENIILDKVGKDIK